MKKAAIVSGTIGVIIVVLTLLFKLHHWDGAGYLLGIGTLFNCIIVLPIIAIYLYMGNLDNKNIYLFGTVSAFILYAGLFFKINHWDGALLLQTVGTVLFIIFIILIALNLYKSPKE